MGLPYWSLMVYEARRRGADGVICGHVHRPEMRTIDGVVYFNDGDRVESCSALVEHFDGRFELIHWPNVQIARNPDSPVHAHKDGEERLVSAG